MFDIVIPLGPNELDKINKQILFVKKNILDYRNIYIISCNIQNFVDGCIIIDENSFPFKKSDIAKYHGKLQRNSWYLQQLLKLYAGFVIPDILENYLVIDADTYFLKPTKFIEDNKNLYASGREHNKPYFEHMEKLHPSLKKYFNESGICHHMMFNSKIIKELFQLVENYHNKQFWIAFLECVPKNKFTHSGASEYEIYYNYVFQFHSEKVQKRKLIWSNKKKNDIKNGYNITNDINNDYVSLHHWM